MATKSTDCHVRSTWLLSAWNDTNTNANENIKILNTMYEKYKMKLAKFLKSLLCGTQDPINGFDNYKFEL